MSLFKKTAKKLKKATDLVSETVSEVGDKISETAKEASEGVKEAIDNASRYTPEDFANDYFMAKDKIAAINEEVRELASEVEYNSDCLFPTLFENLEQGTVLYITQGQDTPATSYFIVNELMDDGVTIKDITDREFIFDASKMLRKK